jgi:predicted DCC family thiol-disulfide oxidoreductase YuxK
LSKGIRDKDLKKMFKFIYKNKKTGITKYSNHKIDDNDFVLVSCIKDGSIKSGDKNIIKK